MSDAIRQYAVLEARLGHRFASPQHLENALTHKSFVNENLSLGRTHNERLEFLGDTVLGLAVSHLLMDEHPSRPEGELSKMRAAIVSETALAEIARELDLGQWLFLGRGEEQSGGRQKPSVLADACEAIIAAIYLDAGFLVALECVRRLLGERTAAAEQGSRFDHKTRLQERAAQTKRGVRYQLVSESGPDHEKTFEIAVFVGDEEAAKGVGRTKKEAEQRAAELALAGLEEPTLRGKR